MADASDALDRGERTAVDLCLEFLERARRRNAVSRAFVRLADEEEVVRAAAAADDRRRRDGRRASVLDGLPVSVKANVAVAGWPLTAGSRVLGLGDADDDAHVAHDDADVVRRLLRERGAVLIGSTTMDEFGMGSLGANAPAVARNPLDPRRVVGGSSSGAAAAVADRSCLLSIGTDTGGSVRLPACWTGTTGYKPSPGRISRRGVVEYAASLDTVGLIAPTPRCVAAAYRAIVDDDDLEDRRRGDATLARYDDDDDEVALEGRPLRVGVPAAFSLAETPSFVARAWDDAAAALRDDGLDVVSLDSSVLSPDLARGALAAYYVTACAEAASALARYDGVRYGAPRRRLGDEVVRRVLCGTAVSSSDLSAARNHSARAARLRGELARAADRVFASGAADVLLWPTATSAPPLLSDDVDPTETLSTDATTVAPSLCGLPAASVPAPPRYGPVPGAVGLQIVGPRGGDERVLRAATRLYDATRR